MLDKSGAGLGHAGFRVVVIVVGGIAAYGNRR